MGVVLGRELAPWSADPKLHVALLGVGVVLVLGVLLTAEPGKNPLGYANANAALAVQVVALAGLAMLAAPRRGRRLLVVALALAALSTLLNRSAAGVAVALPVAVSVGLAAWRPPRRRWWVMLLAAATTVVAAAVLLRAAASPVFPGWADRIFDSVREQLWHDAVALWRTKPVAGAGVGSFPDATALSVDPDTSTAHSSVLQVGAETGWVGVALFGAVALAGLLWTLRAPAPQTIVAATAWTALLVHSYVDHLIEFTPVVLAAGLVLGWAEASHPSEQLDVPEGQGPVTG